MNKSVVLAYDNVGQADRALALAVWEAVDRGDALAIVRAHRLGRWTAQPPEGTTEPLVAWRDSVGEALEQAVAAVRARRPGLPVETRIVSTTVPRVLAMASEDAELVVVAEHARAVPGRGLLSALASGLLAEARCPVIVMRGASRPTQDRLLAAVDVEGSCEPVLAFGFEEADRRGAELKVVNVWNEPPIHEYREGPERRHQMAQLKSSRQDALDELVQNWRDKYPEVRVTVSVATGAIGDSLLRASTTADLAVIGAARRGTDRVGVRVGPAAHTLLRRSACPVALVPLG
ncbi:MAG: universal stress protein [Catenulispora sp.]|nr:universal stress protein [Catenulispora sp.]